MTTEDEIAEDPRLAAADLLRALLEALPPAGPRDVGLRSAVDQRAAALIDVTEFEQRVPTAMPDRGGASGADAAG